jgi:hypothetical protein
MKLSPIILFAYKRPNELKKVLEALEKNYLATESELYIFVDGPRKKEDNAKVDAVRKLCDEIVGFKKVTRIYHETNQGCANSIINGISSVLKNHESAIIIEDDIVTSANFLDYSNQCLDFYRQNKTVFSISGFSLPFAPPKDYPFDVFSFTRSCSWGWSTWSDRWFAVDWGVADFDNFMNDSKAQKEFCFGGSDMVKMLNDYMKGSIDAWDIRFSYSQFKRNGFTIYPIISKVENIGFDTDATHTNVFNRYKTHIDKINKRIANLPDEVVLLESFVKQFQQKFSVLARITGRIKTALGMR